MATPTKEILEEFLNNFKDYDYKSHMADALIYGISAIKMNTKYREINRMSYHCRATEQKMNDLRHCGCDRCRDEYYRLERDYYRQRDYYRAPPMYAPVGLIETKKEIKMTEIDEPKNVAVKHLVDKLKSEQSVLTSHKLTIDSHKKTIAQYNGLLKDINAKKLTSEKNIRELSVALKKLGHKE